MALVWDRDAPHLIEQVILVDPDRLYAFTCRTPADEALAAALRAIGEIEGATEPARQLLQDLTKAWTQGNRLVGLGANNIEETCALIRATDAAFAQLGPNIPLRTRSARLLGDSKALERAIPSILTYLRQAGIIGCDLSRDDALEHLGLTKYAQPVLAAGPLIVGGVEVSHWPYAGLPPELVAGVRISGALRSILTIENLESFNRHVRGCRQPGDLVVYTGGFPNASVLALLRAVFGTQSSILHHWGDIDPGGVRIGRHLETTLSATILPHLMDVELAHRVGRSAEGSQLAPTLPAESAFFDLAEYLRHPEALWLEQEVVDPEAVAVAEVCSNQVQEGKHRAGGSPGRGHSDTAS